MCIRDRTYERLLYAELKIRRALIKLDLSVLTVCGERVISTSVNVTNIVNTNDGIKILLV